MSKRRALILTSVSEIRKNHREPDLGSRVAGGERSSDFWYKVGELTRLSE